MLKVVRLFEDDTFQHEEKMIKELDLAIDLQVRPSVTEAEVIENAKDADVIITVYEPLTENVLKQLPNLKIVLFRSIGFNTIDLEYANQINLPVSHISRYCTDEVANYVIAAILMHNRRLHDFNQAVKQDHVWDYEMFPDMRRLSSLTVSLIGFGNIPRLIVERLKSFGPKVIAYDPFVTQEAMADYGVEKVSLEEAFQQGDYISSHLPLNAKTEKLLDEKLFNLTTKAPIFINSSRGGVVSEDALYHALTNGQLSYAILDVLTSEDPDLKNEKLLTLSNTILTPHIAFYSQEAFIQGAEDNFKNLANFLNGKYKEAEIVNASAIEKNI